MTFFLISDLLFDGFMLQVLTYRTPSTKPWRKFQLLGNSGCFIETQMIQKYKNRDIFQINAPCFFMENCNIAWNRAPYTTVCFHCCWFFTNLEVVTGLSSCKVLPHSSSLNGFCQNVKCHVPTQTKKNLFSHKTCRKVVIMMIQFYRHIKNKQEMLEVSENATTARWLRNVTGIMRRY